MQPKLYLSLPAVCLSLIMVSSAQAAEVLSLQDISMKKLQQRFQLIMPGLRNTLNNSDSLQYLRHNTDDKGITHTRMQQQYDGFNVYGGYAIIHRPQNDSPSLTAELSGTLFHGLVDELGPMPKRFVDDSGQALNHFKKAFHGKKIDQDKVTPMVYMDEQNKAHWAYTVSIRVLESGKIPQRPTAILDAETHSVFMQWDDIQTLNSAVQGQGYGGNSKTGEYVFGKNFPYLNITRNAKNAQCFMENTDVKIIDMEHEEDPLLPIRRRVPLAFSCPKNDTGSLVFWTGKNADGYDRANGANSPSNEAIYAGEVIKNMYREWFGIDVLHKRNGAPMQLIMRVHYGQNYDNAFWDNSTSEMTFGDGGRWFYPLISVDVSSHEVSHGFTYQNSNLYYVNQSGGMNESFSDMAGQAAQYYVTGKNDWMIGSDIVKESSGMEALRYMDMPSKDGQSADTIEDYLNYVNKYGSMNVHYSSGIYNRLYYLMSTMSDWNPRKAFEVMVRANRYYWGPYETFSHGACGVLSAAKDIGYSREDIKQSMDIVGINYNGCKN